MREFKYLLALVFCILNVFLVYVLAHSPYHMFLRQPDYSYIHYKTRESISGALTLMHILILFSSVVWPFIYFRRTKKASLFPAFVGIVTVLFLIWFHYQHYYPDGIKEFSRNGYRYRIETWYLDGENKYKRWRSTQPEKGIFYKEIEWQLDSAGAHH